MTDDQALSYRRTLYLRFRAAGVCVWCAMGFSISAMEYEMGSRWAHRRPQDCTGGKRGGSTCRQRAMEVELSEAPRKEKIVDPFASV